MFLRLNKIVRTIREVNNQTSNEAQAFSRGLLQFISSQDPDSRMTWELAFFCKEKKFGVFAQVFGLGWESRSLFRET